MEIQIATLQAHADQQFANDMRRAQRKAERAAAKKQELYDKEDELFEEMSSLKEEVPDGVVETGLKFAGSFLGVTKSPFKTNAQIAEIQAELQDVQEGVAVAQGEHSRAMEGAHRAVGKHARASSSTEQSLKSTSAAKANSSHGKARLGTSVATAKVTVAEGQRLETAEAVIESSSARAERSRDTQVELVKEAHEKVAAQTAQHTGLLSALGNVSATLTVARAFGAMGAVVAANPVALFHPMTQIKVLLEMAGAGLATSVGSGVLGAITQLSGETIHAKEVGAAKNDAAELRVEAEKASQAAASADALRDEALDQADQAHQTIAEIRAETLARRV